MIRRGIAAIGARMEEMEAELDARSVSGEIPDISEMSDDTRCIRAAKGPKRGPTMGRHG